MTITNLSLARRPLYASLADTLLERIEDGSYPVGSLLPTEAELCAQFGLSRTTVREAIRALKEIGLISRRAGVGTVVRAKQSKPAFSHTVGSISDIFQYPWESSKPVLVSSREVAADEDESQLLHCARGQRWVRFEFVRSLATTGNPMAFVVGYVPLEFGKVVAQLSTTTKPTYTHLESMYGVRVLELQQELRSVKIGSHHAGLLHVKRGAPGLHVVRHYYGTDDRILMVTISIYPAERFSYSIRLKNESQATRAAE